MRRILALAALAANACTSAPEPPSPIPADRHVALVHLDGYRPDVVASLLDEGRLPHLARLLARGRISYDTMTVDKSETMKVVQSYLTSQLDTRVTGWWEFDRQRFAFRNYWLDPAEVMNYALGLEFPVHPTIQDFLASRGENLVAGMSLARRSVPFENYGRAYLEGATAVSDHTYHRQARATMSAFLDIHRRIERDGEAAPALSTLLLAAADEFSHLEGVTIEGDAREFCLSREDAPDETLFELIDEGSGVDAEGGPYFSRLERTPITGRVEGLCVELTRIEGRRAEPHYLLSILMLDLELGRMIDAFAETRYAGGESLFDRTLFVVFGDHGMVDTPLGMSGSGGPREAPSLPVSFIEYLNDALGLETGSDGTAVAIDAELGIDDERLPRRLQHPESYPGWQGPDELETSEAARLWARDFVAELRELLRDNLHESYWWLFFLRSLLIDPKLDQTLGPVEDEAERLLRRIYLRAEPGYLAAERAANREYFDRHVKLVYGGGARNNAELFIPACSEGGACSWRRRPSRDQILAYRGGAGGDKTLLQALEAHPGVGLVFLRVNNEAFDAEAELPGTVEIEVRDPQGNRGFIRVTPDTASGELVFHYRTDPETVDPMGYGRWGGGEGTLGTYNEWNDRTVDEPLVNVVGGMGAYLYSNNPSIGDVVVMHSGGWNFGENLGGHGGLHLGEKKTFLLVSGPGVAPGDELLARRRFRTTASGEVVSATDGTHAPTLLDIVPTTLAYLGHSPEAFDEFARESFPTHLDEWIRAQRGDVLAHLDSMSSLDKAKEEAGLTELSFGPLRGRLYRLLAFTESEREATLTGLRPRPVRGNELILQ